MTERPIMFSGSMIRAILDGRKTQTRRVVTPQPPSGHDRAAWFSAPVMGWANQDPPADDWHKVRCPYGAPGSRLWVREAWRYHDWTEDGLPWIRYAADDAHRLCERIPDDWRERVCDAWAELSDPDNYAIDGAARDRVWRPSIFMPRWASRLTLDVTEVRVERLHAIAEEDARAEGVTAVPFTDDDLPPSVGYMLGSDDGRSKLRATAVGAFGEGWDAINGKRAPWSSNPWVWVVGFRRVEVAP